MLIQELRRNELAKYGLGGRKPTQSATAALKKIDDQLEYHWNLDSFQWEVYRVKRKGTSVSEDILSFQKTVPSSEVTAGTADWLKKFDRNPMGMKTSKELELDFLKEWEVNKEKIRKDRLTKNQDLHYEYNHITHWWESEHKQIAVPITIGFNKKTGKTIRAYPKGITVVS